MAHNKYILAIGIITILMPFLGFPSTWRTIYYVLAGLCLVIIAVNTHIQERTNDTVERHEVVTEVFVETNGKERP